MSTSPLVAGEPLAPADAFYRRMLEELGRSQVPYLVGGAYAFTHFTGIHRDTKDFDIFVRKGDVPRVLQVLAGAGCEVEVFSPHWLAKAYSGDDFMDIIHGAGNGVAVVDDLWFVNAAPGEVLGLPVLLTPAEEMIWSKAFIMERERYDGADVAHLLHQQAPRLDWERLLQRFAGHWRVLLAHLTLFAFIYPQRRQTIPDWVMSELVRRLRREQREPPAAHRICRGTLLSRNQYAIDIDEWGYTDGRLPPEGTMSQTDIDLWERQRRIDAGELDDDLASGD